MAAKERRAASRNQSSQENARNDVRGMFVRGIIGKAFFIPLTNIPLTLSSAWGTLAIKQHKNPVENA
jgi:hypothetical protein